MECLQKNGPSLECGEDIICKGTGQEPALRMKAVQAWAESAVV